MQEPHVGLDLWSPGSHPGPKAALNRWATRAAHVWEFLMFWIFFSPQLLSPQSKLFLYGWPGFYGKRTYLEKVCSPPCWDTRCWVTRRNWKAPGRLQMPRRGPEGGVGFRWGGTYTLPEAQGRRDGMSPGHLTLCLVRNIFKLISIELLFTQYLNLNFYYQKWERKKIPQLPLLYFLALGMPGVYISSLSSVY